MGYCSTINVTRTKAKEYLIHKLMSASDYHLGVMMDSFLDERCYNCQIVNDDNEENDNELVNT